LRFGAILVLELVTKSQGLFDRMTERYTILHNNKILYKNLTEEEYFDMMEDLSIEFYQTGFPRPQELKTKITKEY
jgi:hypothetical protein